MTESDIQAAEERAARLGLSEDEVRIVAWLRERCNIMDLTASYTGSDKQKARIRWSRAAYQHVADVIERGEHRSKGDG